MNKVPAVPEPARFSFLTAAAPLLGGILMALALQEPRFLIFTLLAPITGAAGWFESKKRTRERHERDLVAFEKRLAEREEAMTTAYAEEETARLAAAPDIADLRRRAEQRDRTLWSRGRDIPEFLSLRVGTGPVETDITAAFSTEGDEEQVTRLEDLAERFRGFERMPVTVPLRDLGVLGMHGPRREVAALAKGLLIQAVCLHSPEDLVVVAAASPEMDLVELAEVGAPHPRHGLTDRWPPPRRRPAAPPTICCRPSSTWPSSAPPAPSTASTAGGRGCWWCSTA